MNKLQKTLVTTLAISTAFGVGMALQAKFSDVPANLWAAGAVNRMVAEGIINGYPDGTFKGNNTVNRYEATSMFDRLISSKRFTALETNSQAAAKVSNDLSALRAAGSSNAATIAALQADIAALKTSAGTANSPELLARVTELEAKVAAISTSDNASYNARITALEGNFTTLLETVSAAKPSNSELDVRLAALEAKSSSTADLTAKVEAQGAQISALEGQVRTLNTTVAALKTATPTAPSIPSSTTPTPSVPSSTTPDAPTAPDAVATPAASSTPALYVALGISTNLIPGSPIGGGSYRSPLGLGGYAQLGLNLSDSFSIRLNADLSEIPSYGANLMLNLGGGLYTGLGGGIVVDNGFYAGGVFGFSFDIAQNFAVFLELNPRYNFGNSSFGIKTALGLRLGL